MTNKEEAAAGEETCTLTLVSGESSVWAAALTAEDLDPAADAVRRLLRMSDTAFDLPLALGSCRERTSGRGGGEVSG